MAHTSSQGISSPRTVLPAVPPPVLPAAPPQRGPRIRHTARKQVILPGRLPNPVRGQGTPSSLASPPHFSLHPSDPYATSLTPAMDRYMWERLMQRPDGAGPSRPVLGTPAERSFTPAEYHALHAELQGLSREAEEQAHLLFQVSDAAHRLSEHSVRVSTTTQATSRTIQRLVGVCLVMGTILAIIVLKMLIDMLTLSSKMMLFSIYLDHNILELFSLILILFQY
jgi:hypothetical protein